MIETRRKTRRGFATVMALVSLTLVGIAVAGMTMHLSMQSRRTTREGERAQQEQITIAKSLGADVKLPNELRKQKQSPTAPPRESRG